MYSNCVPLVASATTASVLAFYELGQYFDSPFICEQAEQFWSTNMTVENSHEYYKQAKIFHNDKVLEAVKKTCTDALLTCGISHDSQLITCLSITDWLDIFDGLPDNRRALNLSGSALVLLICQRDDVDWIVFEKLTSDKLLPKIQWEAAVPFLKIEAKFMETQESSSTSVDLSNDEFTSLQHRCADALAAYGSICSTNKEIMDYLLQEKFQTALSSVQKTG
jgi:hypothetical protein